MAEIVADKPFLPRQRTLVVIHGNIGAGKSTTLRSLCSKYERYVAMGSFVEAADASGDRGPLLSICGGQSSRYAGIVRQY